MKQKDIALIIVVTFLSGIISLFASNALFASPKNRQQKVEVVEAISASFPTPSTKYFNSESINPTELIQIGTSQNPNPFNGASQ